LVDPIVLSFKLLCEKNNQGQLRELDRLEGDPPKKQPTAGSIHLWGKKHQTEERERKGHERKRNQRIPQAPIVDVKGDPETGGTHNHSQDLLPEEGVPVPSLHSRYGS
jgi:hypothetical protein